MRQQFFNKVASAGITVKHQLKEIIDRLSKIENIFNLTLKELCQM